MIKKAAPKPAVATAPATPVAAAPVDAAPPLREPKQRRHHYGTQPDENAAIGAGGGNQCQARGCVAGYYSEYHGHDLEKLGVVHSSLRRGGEGENPAPSCLWLLGDSSFDNKYWLEDRDWSDAVMRNSPLSSRTR